MSMAEREVFLARIRARLGARRNTAPAAGASMAPAQPPQETRSARFAEAARGAQATIDRVRRADEVPEAVARFLASAGLPPLVRVDGEITREDIPWARAPGLSLVTGPAEASDKASLTLAFAGVAETGTLVMRSSPDAPTTLHFLPETEIVLLPTSRLVERYEEAWSRLSAGANETLPRTVNFITGPSRTADIELIMALGAHGPRRLHIILIDEI